MKRLTQHIGLVLISSSLVLNGCYRPAVEQKKRQLTEEQRKAEGQDQAQEKEAERLAGGPATGSTTSSSSNTYHSGSHIYHGGGVVAPLIRTTPRASTGVTSTPPSTRATAGSHTTTGARSSSGTHTASSARGGFGGSAHGASS